MATTAELSIYVSIHDLTELWHAAARQAVADGAFDTEEQYKSEYPRSDATNHLRMILDRGTPQNSGFEILDSSCELDASIEDEDEDEDKA